MCLTTLGDFEVDEDTVFYKMFTKYPDKECLYPWLVGNKEIKEWEWLREEDYKPENFIHQELSTDDWEMYPRGFHVYVHLDEVLESSRLLLRNTELRTVIVRDIRAKGYEEGYEVIVVGEMMVLGSPII